MASLCSWSWPDARSGAGLLTWAQCVFALMSPQWNGSVSLLGSRLSHIFVPNVLHSAWHIVGLQQTLVEWMHAD